MGRILCVEDIAILHPWAAATEGTFSAVNGTEGTGTGADSGAHVAQHLADIARILLAPGSVAETLNLIVTMSVASASTAATRPG